MIPEGWKAIKLGSIANKVTSGARDWAKHYSDSGAKFIRMTNLSRDGIHLNLEKLKYVDIKNSSTDGQRTSLQEGDILISITAELGKIGLVPHDLGQSYINQHTALVRVNGSYVSPIYIAYLLSSRPLNYIINKMNDAGAKSGLNLSTVKAIPISLPPLPEQKKIAQILSTWDKAIETVEKLIANSQQKKKALMQQLLTGKKRFPEFDGEWKEVRLVDVLNDKKRKGKIVPTNENQSGMAYIGSTSFDGNFGIYTDSANAVTCLPNDILVLWDGENAGKVTSGLTGAVSSTVVRYCINQEKANSPFLTYNLLRDNYKVRAIREGSGIPHMPGDFEQWYRIALPPLEEQERITSILSSTDQEIETWQQELTHLKQEKKALMQQLLTGKRRVKLSP